MTPATRPSEYQVGQIKIVRLEELWIHTGTACNLECPFCLEGSKPGDTRLERPTRDELKPHLDAAVTLGAKRFIFTGGEPLIVKDIVKTLEYALQLKPCTVFTNGTAPLIKRVHQLAALKQQAHALTFRVSLDHPDEASHDAARGWGNFKRALDGMRLLHMHGFDMAIARHLQPAEDTAAVERRFRDVLRKHGLPMELPITALPEFGLPGAKASAPITTAELARAPAMRPLCAESRMLVKRDGQIRVYACALVDDDLTFEMGTDLSASLQMPIELRHHRCRQCLLGNRY